MTLGGSKTAHRGSAPPRTSSAAAATGGVPASDEALRTSVEKFRDDPRSEAPFVELSAALLARGHAAEALKVVEHGLQGHPRSVEGRSERAAALLALGRPRVAFVELRRVLALAPGHRRALRLLGQAFKDAGAPARAAELLLSRPADARETLSPADEATAIARVPAAATEPNAPIPSEPAELDANLFRNLTVDLGLGAVVPAASQPVAVTQVIRRKGMPRPPRSASELAAIDGPIVDTAAETTIESPHDPSIDTQPGTIVPSSEAPTDFTALLALGDEPLFDGPSVAVQPVSTHDLIVDDLDEGAPRTSDTWVDRVEANEAPPPELPPVEPAPLLTPLSEAPSAASSSEGDAIVERPARRHPRLEVQAPNTTRGWLLHLLAAALMLGIAAAMVLASAEPLGVWVQTASIDE